MAGKSESKMLVPQRSDWASDSLINGLSLDSSAPSPGLTIHADPKNNTPAPDFTMKEGERGGESRRISSPKKDLKKDSKIIRDPLTLSSCTWLPQMAVLLFSLAQIKAWRPPSDSYVGGSWHPRFGAQAAVLGPQFLTISTTAPRR